MSEAVLRRQAIEGFMNRVYYNPIWVDLEFLEQSGILESVTEMLALCGWPGLMELSGPCDKEDTAEFLATLNYSRGEFGREKISYRFRGRSYDCSLEEMRGIFGWPAEGEIYLPPMGRWPRAWYLLAPRGYNGGNTSPRHFTDPALFYMHQILSKTLFARKNVDKVGQLEMGVLVMLKDRTRVCWEHYWCTHMMSLRANSPIACGGMVTYFLRQRHHPREISGHTVLPAECAGWLWFRHGRHVQRAADGGIEWIYFRDETLRAPPPERRPRGRPPTRGRGQRHALVGREPDDSEDEAEPDLGQQSAPMQEQLARQFRDTVFNATRASILAGQRFEIAPAPPGWNMGDPIPPEYLRPSH